eukprot:g1020.t1
MVFANLCEEKDVGALLVVGRWPVANGLDVSPGPDQIVLTPTEDRKVTTSGSATGTAQEVQTVKTQAREVQQIAVDAAGGTFKLRACVFDVDLPGKVTVLRGFGYVVADATIENGGGFATMWPPSLLPHGAPLLVADRIHDAYVNCQAGCPATCDAVNCPAETPMVPVYQGNLASRQYPAKTCSWKETTNLAFGATAAQIKAALLGLGANSPYGTDGVVAVSGPTAGATANARTWKVTFTAALNDLPKMQIDTALLTTTGATAGAITEVANGTPLTVRSTYRQTLGGTFKVQIPNKLLAAGAGSAASPATTATIAHDASADAMKAALDAAVAAVPASTPPLSFTVTRSDVDNGGGYSWSITFTRAAGNELSLLLPAADAAFTKDGVALTLAGTQTTAALAFDESATGLATKVAAAAPGGLLAVASQTRTGPSGALGYVWSLVFSRTTTACAAASEWAAATTSSAAIRLHPRCEPTVAVAATPTLLGDGAAVAVTSATTVTLTGSATGAAGGVTYAWTRVHASSTETNGVTAGVTFGTANAASTTATGLATGRHVFKLVVTDAGTAPATVKEQLLYVYVNKYPPKPGLVSTPAALTVTSASGAKLNAATLSLSAATSTDQDGTITGYAWSSAASNAALSPAGLTFSAATAQVTTVSGFTSTGTYRFVHTLTDNEGNIGRGEIFVVVAITAPSISVQPPTTASGNPSAGLTLAVTAQSPVAETYLWSRNGVALAATAYGGTAAARELVFTSLTEAMEGTYTVTVTNTAGSVTSTGVALTVNDPPAITMQTSLPVAAQNPGST